MNPASGTAIRSAASLLRKRASWAALFGCVLALSNCEDGRIAGSSVTTGNPTEIQVGFTGENGPVALSGRVEIYAATQIPVPGFRPEPLGRFDVNGTSFTLTASHFESIADSMWAKGSLDGDSLARFNLVVTSTKDKGSILRDFTYRLKDHKFALKEGSFTAGTGGAVSVKADITSLTDFKAVIPVKGLDSTRFNYLFLKGTGYSALSEEGVFKFRLPAGSQPVSFLSLPDKRNNSSVEDSAYVYSADAAIEPGKETVLGVSGLDFRITMPPEYRP